MEKTEYTITAISHFCLLLTLLLLCGASVARAETAVGGAIVANTTWSAANGPYLVTSDVSVESGALLTVEGGVTVRFQTGRRLIVHNGALRAAGTVTAPVTFTSALDIPNGTPAAGDWGGLQFLDGTVDAATSSDFLTVRYGSTTAMYGASPTFNNCRFEHNSGYALSIDLASFPHGSGNSAAGNGINAIKVPAGEMTTSGAWDFTAIPYFLDGTVSIGAAPTLSGITPATVEQGSSVDAVISGTRLDGAGNPIFADPAITAVIQPGGSSTALPVQLTIGSSAPFGIVGFTLPLAAGDVAFPSGVTVIPPRPHITSMTPDRAFVGRDVTVGIIGTNFSADSVAYLGAVALTTTFVSVTQLQAAVPAQQAATIGQLVVKNPDPVNLVSYLVSNSALFTVELPQFTVTPATLSLRQGAVDTLTLSIPFAAPAGGIIATLTSTNTAAATVPATATIPEGATSVAVTVAAPDTVNSHDVTLEVHANQNNWIGNKATVTVRPEPTVNLSPVTILAGQGFTFFLTVNLTDPAPAGGLAVALAAAPVDVVTLPASVTVSEGATQAQVTVTNSGIGTTVITGTPATGKGFSAGDSCTVTVRPIQTTNVTPLVSPAVGIRVETALTPNSRDVTYTPLLSRVVGIVSGPIVTGMTPDHAPLGTQSLLIRVDGNGFAADSSVQIAPTQLTPTPLSDVTLNGDPLVIAADGSYVEFRVNIASDAQISDRIITVTSGGRSVPPATADANRFKVTWPAPELWSLANNSAVVNTSMTLQLSGRFFQGATSIAVEPPQGILVGTPISVNADGTSATVPVYISPDATPGSRAVSITTPGGSTAATIQTGNVLTILAVPGSTYTPLVSAQVGVSVATAPPSNSQDVTYTPLVSRPAGVALGPVITGVVPLSGAIGTTDLRVRVTGVDLSAVDSFTIEPNTGLTIIRPDPPVAADGSWAEALVTIAADAPLTQRMVILKAGTAVIPAATAEANRFNVTLPLPEMTSIFPNRSKAGSSFAFTVNGRLLNGATAVSFSPPDGITVSALSVAGDGARATTTVAIDTGATPGQRIVTITTPGGTTSSAPTINTFEVIGVGVPEATYTPILSSPVGVSVSSASQPIDHLVDYGPIVSGAVGVSIPLPAPATTHDVSYTPIVSRPVGIAVGAVMTGMTPAAIEPDTTSTLTFSGKGLDAVTSLELYPGDGLTIGTLNPSVDGLSLTVDVSAAVTAPRAPRSAVLKTAAGLVSSPVTGSNILYVGYKPAIVSLDTILKTVGDTFTLSINGNNLDAATRVRFEPPDGIFVVNPPVINAGGTIASVTVTIDGMAAGGQRNVVIEGPYGSSGTSVFTVDRPVVSAPAPLKYAAEGQTPDRTSSPVAGTADSSALMALLLYAAEAIPVVRKPLDCRTAAFDGVSWVVQDDACWKEESKADQGSALQLLALVGWGYRAPPS